MFHIFAYVDIKGRISISPLHCIHAENTCFQWLKGAIYKSELDVSLQTASIQWFLRSEASKFCSQSHLAFYMNFPFLQFSPLIWMIRFSPLSVLLLLKFMLIYISHQILLIQCYQLCIPTAILPSLLFSLKHVAFNDYRGTESFQILYLQEEKLKAISHTVSLLCSFSLLKKKTKKAHRFQLESFFGKFTGSVNSG